MVPLLLSSAFTNEDRGSAEPAGSAKHRMAHKLSCFPFLPIAGLVLSCTACNRPVWEEKSATRRQAIHDEVCRFRDHEAAGKERLAHTGRRIHKMHCYHKEHLKSTTEFVRGEIDSDQRRWCEEREKRRAFARRYFRDQPDTIPHTWARMVY